jgi:hypothetical protein
VFRTEVLLWEETEGVKCETRRKEDEMKNGS